MLFCMYKTNLNSNHGQEDETRRTRGEQDSDWNDAYANGSGDVRQSSSRIRSFSIRGSGTYSSWSIDVANKGKIPSRKQLSEGLRKLRDELQTQVDELTDLIDELEN